MSRWTKLVLLLVVFLWALPQKNHVQADEDSSVTLAFQAEKLGKQVNHSRRVVPVLFVPRDVAPETAYLDVINETLRTVQDWYAVQLGGPTFHFIPTVWVRGQHPNLDYCPTQQSTGKCLQKAEGTSGNPESALVILQELDRQGIREGPGSILVVFWQGGNNNAQGSTTSPTSGYVLLGDWALEGTSGKFEKGSSTSSCLTSQFAYAFCKKNAQIGSVAHELAHAFDIPHPRDDGRANTDPQFWFKSVMQAPWDWPNVVFLDNPANPEKARLRRSPFFWRTVIIPGLSRGP